MGCTLSNLEAGNIFALLGFVPDALGEYLTNLRWQLVSDRPFKSHVTLLPPRVLSGSAEALSGLLGRRLASIEPFEVSLGQVEVFPATGVIYLGIEAGSDTVRRIHAMLASDEFAYPETYPFHPHLTLAQDYPPLDSDELVDRARALWNSWQGERRFLLDRLSFVRGVDLCTWQTVSEHVLNHSQRPRTV